MNFFDIYIDDPSEMEEGHNPDQLYARVPVTDTKGEVLTYLCRVNEDQLLYLDAEEIPYTTWNTVDVSGKRKDIKATIKDKEAKDKAIPTIVFGSGLSSPECARVTPTKEIDSAAIIEKPKEVAVAAAPEVRR